MYSAGAPILYPISCLFYAVLYWVYKVLLLKYYQRTTKFNEELAIYSLGLIKWGIIFHMLMAAFMYSNVQIFSTK